MIKRQRLEEKLLRAQRDVADGNTIDGEPFFSECLINPQTDEALCINDEGSKEPIEKPSPPAPLD